METQIAKMGPTKKNHFAVKELVVPIISAVEKEHSVSQHHGGVTEKTTVEMVLMKETAVK